MCDAAALSLPCHAAVPAGTDPWPPRSRLLSPAIAPAAVLRLAQPRRLLSVNLGCAVACTVEFWGQRCFLSILCKGMATYGKHQAGTINPPREPALQPELYLLMLLFF